MKRLSNGTESTSALLVQDKITADRGFKFDWGKIFELYWCRKDFFVLQKYSLAATIIFGDNDSSAAMANAGKPTSRSRHIDVKFYAIQEWTELDLILIKHIGTALNMKDSFCIRLRYTRCD